MASALAQYQQARAFVQQARSSFFPTVLGNASITKQKQSISNLQVANVAVGNTPASIISEEAPFNIINLGLDVLWEPDLWGAVRRNVESTVASAQADAAFAVLTKLLAKRPWHNIIFNYAG